MYTYDCVIHKKMFIPIIITQNAIKLCSKAYLMHIQIALIYINKNDQFIDVAKKT